MKLHGNILSASTKRGLLSEASAIVNAPLSGHAELRLAQKGISIEDVRLTVSEGTLIEFHDDRGTRRILLRHNQGTCVVVDLDKKVIVTAYFNNPTDNHRTIRTQEYAFGRV